MTTTPLKKCENQGYMSELDFERYIFEIGIYPSKPDKFYDQRSRRLEDYLLWLSNKTGGLTRKQAPETFAKAEEHFLMKYGGWRYTQAIGWLRLYILGTQIRGETWFVEAKRVTRTMKEKKFTHWGKAFELEFMFEEVSSIDIYEQILDEIKMLSTATPYKGRYIDLESFRNLAPFVNWRSLIGLDL